jgi:hypothetical protein
MQIKYRIQVDDQVCETNAVHLGMIVMDLLHGNSELRKEPIKPEEIRITVHEAEEPKPALWRKVESK